MVWLDEEARLIGRASSFVIIACLRALFAGHDQLSTCTFQCILGSQTIVLVIRAGLGG